MTSHRNDPLARFGQVLRAWRNKRRVSQAHLAAEVPVHRDLISKIENGRRWPTLALIRIADKYLGADGDLCGWWPVLEAAHMARRNVSFQVRVRPERGGAAPPGQSLVTVCRVAAENSHPPEEMRDDIVLVVGRIVHTQLTKVLSGGKPVRLLLEELETQLADNDGRTDGPMRGR